MWRLTEIYAQNICSFRELHFTPQQGVTTLIFGDNRDNESQRSNGSGKSALIECVAIGITGSPLRKVKNEEIINDNCLASASTNVVSDECLIELQFKNDSNNETFIVERKLFRKSASEVVCSILSPNNSKPEEKVEPNIDAYNKFILEKLGITKDELYNNFILSKHRYQDFLSCSDKDKKEIINRFINGLLVDGAIERILEDKVPFEKSLKETELEAAGIDGRISVLSEQIQEEEAGKEEKTRSRSEKIAGIEVSIREKRNQIRNYGKDLNKLDEDKIKLKSVDEQIQTIENSDRGLEECLSQITTKLETLEVEKLSNWQEIILLKKEQVEKIAVGLEDLDRQYPALEKELSNQSSVFLQQKEEFDDFLSRYNQYHNDFATLWEDLDESLSVIFNQNKELKNTRRNLSSAIETLNNKLAGSITCPSCYFEFIVSDKEFDITVGRQKLKETENEQQNISERIKQGDTRIASIEKNQNEIRERKCDLSSLKSEWMDKLALSERNMKSASYKVEEATEQQLRLKNKITSIQDEINNIRRKVFDEVFELLDEAYKTIERKSNSLKEDIQSAEKSVETLEDAIRELKNNMGTDIIQTLKNSLKEYRKKELAVLDRKTRIENELHTLEEQEQNFVMFKTYLANSKIEALGRITNEFLENIGSDIRIKFSGYTVLKTGKVREKISVSLVREGLDCGSFGKFSAGEAARVNLATILSMQKLINSNCDDDKGLDLLVLDEILEAVDEEGLAHMFTALNGIGVTALIVSHGNISESYPHKIKIIKENGESKIEE